MKSTKSTCLLLSLALSATLLSARIVAAQGSSAVRTAVETGNDGWAPVKHLEFLPDDVQGGLLGPEGEPIISVPRAQHESLIEIRSGFEAEIVKTMDTM